MSRPSKFSNEQVLDHCLRLSNQEGIQALTVSAVARSMGAPSGSIYHRFASRDVLVASLWLRTVDRFQQGFLAALDNTDPMTAAVEAARHTLTWSRANMDDAQFLLVHRRQDLLASGWPEEIREESTRQDDRGRQAMEQLCGAFGVVDADVERVHFAVVTIPMGAVRPALSRGIEPSEATEGLTLEAVRAVLAPLAPNLHSHGASGEPT